ncbi:MAG: hypothetical protein JSW63_07120, partial [Ignavibacterium sp.]
DQKNGLLLLHPELGNYTVINHKLFQISEGEFVEFTCPICQENLTSEIDNNLASVFMIDKEDVQHNILFSKINGERCTYKITGGDVESFGEDATNYFDIVKKSITST